ncbi:MAG: 2-polyprenyl-3-methyl-5-hydroxy-6-metoxy-1,4-benzoquinol methylase [Bacteroidetes bacterium HGW-Bacteroidetes-4]|jgi:SAM-dependent methyltransferase|nr:MAG: 2-polyprenyl-3-methyl-5-hydroxy-6-metoxy-1,4-benzoquinol methylase [Bacteroidetes bacterium HGW-Bacteroidetes-4]
MNCTLCDTILDKMADDYYFICPTCGAYVKDKKFFLTSQQEKERYQEHNNDVNDIGYQTFTSPITNAIITNQNKMQLGLDYGSGTGPVISKQLKDLGFQVKLYDFYFYPNQEYINYQYDYIFSCEVFEHFHNPKQEIEKLLLLLKQGGHFYIMTHLYQPKIDFTNWYYRNDPTHVFIFTSKTIEFVARKYNLIIEEMTDRLIILKKNLKK